MTDTRTAKPGQVVGRNLRRIRQERGFSQRRVVGRMRELRFSWHQTTVQGVEKGTRPISIDELFALAACLDTDAASLLDPVPLGVTNVDVGFPWSMPPSSFRWLVPIPEQQGIEPRHVNSAGWEKEIPALGGPYLFAETPAGEANLRRQLKKSEEQLTLERIGRELEELRALVAERKAQE